MPKKITRITKKILVKEIGDMLYAMQIGIVDCWIETVGKGKSKQEFLTVEFIDGTLKDAEVTQKNAWQTAATAILLAGREKVS